jgi:hypothetical protein
MDQGREVLRLGADQARERYQKIRARFPDQAPTVDFKGALQLRRNGRELELVANGESAQILETLRRLGPESLTSEALTLEEVFVATLE